MTRVRDTRQEAEGYPLRALRLGCRRAALPRLRWRAYCGGKPATCRSA